MELTFDVFETWCKRADRFTAQEVHVNVIDLLAAVFFTVDNQSVATFRDTEVFCDFTRSRE